MNVVAVGAHPDDVELGCGATLLRHVARGDEVTILVMTTGQRGLVEGMSRPKEQQAAAAMLGVELCWGGFDDGAIPDGAEAIAVIDAVLAASGAEMPIAIKARAMNACSPAAETFLDSEFMGRILSGSAPA